MSLRVRTYLKKREERNTLPKLTMGIWAGSFLMALYSGTLYTPTGGLGHGGIGNLGFVVVLGVFYVWRSSTLNKQLAELQKNFTAEDKQELLREIVG